MQDGEIGEHDYRHSRATELFPDAEDPSREMMSRLFTLVMGQAITGRNAFN